MKTTNKAAVLLLALAALAAPARAEGFFSPEPRLGPAPQAGFELPIAPEAARSKAVQAVPPIDTMNMAAVAAAYNLYYNVPMPALGFTGNVGACNPGAISPSWQEWFVTRINFLRAMAGVPGNTTHDSSRDAQQQAAALIMAANNFLTHSPSPGSLCYTPLGASGAGSSNLALGAADALPLYMSEPGAGNEPVGHRRWILDSRKQNFSVGQAGSANALYAFQRGPVVAAASGIPWPPRGYVPLPIFPTAFTSAQRWSFGLPGADFGGATVSVTRNGSPVAVSVVSRTDNGYGDNTIVWEMPASHSVTAGSTYQVTISGVGAAAQTTYSYQILPFDPANVATDLSVTQAASANPATGRDIVFTMTVTSAGSPTSAPVLTDTLPAGSTFVWASPGCTYASGTVTCNVGTLAAGQSRQVQVVVRRAASGNITNVATVSGAASDSNTANNTSSLQVAVATSPAGVPVQRYRLYSPVTLEHHFTTDLNEYNVLGGLVGTWIQEGGVGRVLNNPGSHAGVQAVPYYRLYDTSTRWHHWTTDPNEYYTLAQFPSWNAEGVDGYIFPSPATGTIQLYRLNYPYLGSLHHWTIDQNEHDTLVASYGWVSEGGSGFVLP